MINDSPIFEPPNQEQLSRRADDLMHRTILVRAHGWNEYRHRWSHGEVLGTALALGDDEELQRCGETVDTALTRWAFTLWGIARSQSDTVAGLPATRAWFNTIRATIGDETTHRSRATR